jgi:hypothetical protein
VKKKYEIRIKFDGVPLIDTRVDNIPAIDEEIKKLKRKMG